MKPFPRTAGADILVNQITVPLLDPDTFSVIPVVTIAVTSYHPCVVIALTAGAEDLAIIIGIRCINVFMFVWDID